MSDHRALIAIVALAAGVAAAMAPPEPTGSPAVDALLVGGGAALIAWLGAGVGSLAFIVVLLAGAASLSWTGLGTAIVVATTGYLLSGRPDRAAPVAAAMTGTAVNLFARSELGGFVGASTLVAVGVGGVVAVIGLRQRPPRDRRIVLIGAGALLVVAMAGTTALAVTVWRATDDLRAGDAAADRGLDALRARDVDGARRAFEDAQAAFERADSLVDSPMTALSSVVPGVAQHRHALTTLSDEARESAATIVEQLADVDLSEFRVRDGRIDIERVRALEPALVAIDQQIRELRQAIDDANSPWLLSPVEHRLGRLRARLDQQLERSADALAVARVAPGLLGGDGPRVYFVGFATPSEARGLGGLLGNWAEITVTDGAIELTDFGRSDDLDEAGVPGRHFTRDARFEEWLRRYGPYNLNSGPDGTTGRQPWKNIDMSPDMEITGAAIADLYPQSGGKEIDGVITLDVYTLIQFLHFTGPLSLTADGQPFVVTPDNAEKFLLNGQYDVTNTDARVDALEDFSREVIDRLLGDALPPIDELADSLEPMIHEGRLTAWMARPSEQEVMRQLGMAGTLPAVSDDDALAIAFNNAAGNKIDYYLHADATYEVHADARSRTATAQLTLSLTNAAPDAGKPQYVIGNPIGLPEGTNRTWVSVFTRLPVSNVRINGTPTVSQPDSEAGYFVTSVFVTVGAGEAAEVTFELAGPLDLTDGYELELRSPPVVRHMPHTVDATWVDRDGVEHSTSETFFRAGRHQLTLFGDE